MGSIAPQALCMVIFALIAECTTASCPPVVAFFLSHPGRHNEVRRLSMNIIS